MTTFRSDVRDGVHTLLTGFQTANPTLLQHVYRRRPGSFPDKISAFVGSMPETSDPNTLLSQRNIAPTAVFVMKLTDPSDEQADRMDDLIDAIWTYVNPRPHAVSNQTVLVIRSVDDVELDSEGTFYPAAVVTFASIALEGR